LPDWVLLLIGFAAYIVLMHFVFPRFGVPT
jgi:hypothetical protein